MAKPKGLPYMSVAITYVTVKKVKCLIIKILWKNKLSCLVGQYYYVYDSTDLIPYNSQTVIFMIVAL